MQSLTEQLVEALEASILRICQGCWLKWPLRPATYEPVDDSIAVRGVGEGDTHEHPRGGVTACEAVKQRRALDRARADPEALLREAGQARRELGERVRDGK